MATHLAFHFGTHVKSVEALQFFEMYQWIVVLTSHWHSTTILVPLFVEYLSDMKNITGYRLYGHTGYVS